MNTFNFPPTNLYTYPWICFLLPSHYKEVSVPLFPQNTEYLPLVSTYIPSPVPSLSFFKLDDLFQLTNSFNFLLSKKKWN